MREVLEGTCPFAPGVAAKAKRSEPESADLHEADALVSVDHCLYFSLKKWVRSLVFVQMVLLTGQLLKKCDFVRIVFDTRFCTCSSTVRLRRRTGVGAEAVRAF